MADDGRFIYLGILVLGTILIPFVVEGIMEIVTWFRKQNYRKEIKKYGKF